MNTKSDTHVPQGKLQAWLYAARLRTLPLTLSCIGMGSFLAAFYDTYQPVVFWLAALTTLFLQVLSNLANDYGDSKHGVDSESREGPARAVQAGVITPAEMKRAMYVFAFLSLASGLLLLYMSLGTGWEAFLFFFVLGLASIGAAIAYTATKKPYGYAGLGDLSVLVFFGLVGVGGTYYLHAQDLSGGIWLPALSVGLLSTAVLNVNNVRDIESDRASGKKSVPVRIGRQAAVYYHIFLLVTAACAAIAFTLLFYESPWQWLFLLSLPMIFINGRAVATRSRAAELDPYLKQMALTTLLFVITFGVGLLLA
ncbi:1,4-dihydroxy-2-naphthoate polyprenyltransferase [Roseivirga sp. BDSF3-8]|uniref:1,4-dihydroxy-2-naphthoate polyprenyltransferase n=1 Tax=Roseivirga sp. BDSF3-8 TaxID=3241598 RepID=UPI0035319A6A